MKKVKGVIAVILIFVLCFQMIAYATTIADYSDVLASHWAYSSIVYVTNKGYMGETNDGVFEPDISASRAMMVTALYRLAGEPTVSVTEKPFSDVALGTWYSAPIAWAKSIGVVDGHDDGTFRPAEEMPREQIALIMYRYADYMDYDLSTVGANIGEFPDFYDTPVGCRTAMQWAIKKGMFVGRDGELQPNASATRAELATCLHRFEINDAPVTGISFTAAVYAKEVGWSGYLPAVISPSNAGNKAVYWTSDNLDVARVEYSTGKVTVIGAGTAVITARTEDGNRTATCRIRVYLPNTFHDLIEIGVLSTDEVECTDDNLFIVTKSLADMLIDSGITNLVDADGNQQTCSLYFDDWYLYGVPLTTDYAYGLYKMREEEFDGIDGDDPGVTVSFVSFDESTLVPCLESPTNENKVNLNTAIIHSTNEGSVHDDDLANYFASTASDGPYLIAEKYIDFMANNSENGILTMPKAYTEILAEIDLLTQLLNDSYYDEVTYLQLYNKLQNYERVPEALQAINSAAGRTIFNSSTNTIILDKKDDLTKYEKMTILTAFCADVNFHSFAAEVEFHADAVYDWKGDIPVVGDQWYLSAIRADISIGDLDEEYNNYYNLESEEVLAQQAAHPEYPSE